MTVHKQNSNFISPQYTIGLIVRFCAVVIPGFLVLGGVLFASLNRTVGPGYLAGITTLNKLHANLPIIILVTGIFQIIVVGGGLIILTLFWAHAVAGPMVRVQRTLDALGRGAQIDPVAFRQGDQLHALTKSLNQVESFQREESATVDDWVDEIQSLFEEYKEYERGPTSESHRQNLSSRINTVCEKIEQHFTAKND